MTDKPPAISERVKCLGNASYVYSTRLAASLPAMRPVKRTHAPTIHGRVLEATRKRVNRYPPTRYNCKVDRTQAFMMANAKVGKPLRLNAIPPEPIMRDAAVAIFFHPNVGGATGVAVAATAWEALDATHPTTARPIAFRTLLHFNGLEDR